MDRQADEDIIREAIGVLKEINSIDTVAGYERITHSIRLKKRNRRLRRYAGIAAAACIVLAVAGILRYQDNMKNDLMAVNSEIKKGPGEKQARLVLTDGTSVDIDQSFHTAPPIDESDALIVTENGVLTYKRKTDGRNAPAPGKQNILEVPKGGEFDIILDDGTHVWLNSGSQLRFPSVFSGPERRVQLEGEAYFEVAKNTARPFIVETAKQTVKVLGTRFNVYSYTEEPRVLTTLIAGSVEVAGKQNGMAHILQPGQQAELDGTSADFLIYDVDAENMIAWKNDYFVFNDQPLEQVMMRLARWYDIRVRYDNEDARHIVFKGNLPKYEDLGTVLNILGKSSSLKFTMINNTLAIGL